MSYRRSHARQIREIKKLELTHRRAVDARVAELTRGCRAGGAR